MRLLAYIVGVALAIHGVQAQKVFAHFMVQNSYSYAQADWAADISAAAAIGIDGFALNIAQNDYESGQLSYAFAAAEAQKNFQLFLSFDMSYSWAASDMATIFNAHASSSAMYKWNNHPLVSTYSGSTNGNSFYAGLKSSLASSGHNISFAPAFTDYSSPTQANQLLSDFPSVDGFFNWWSWPSDNGNLVTTALDTALQSAIKGSRTGPYIMSVSPWQYKNLPTDAWVELSDTLIKYRWEQAIDTVKPDIVEIVTWNDYGESHYIADINPNVNLGTDAPNYVDGFTHSPWRTIMQYYISWFKTGKAPAITTDHVIFWYRAHPKAATCSAGHTVRNSQYPADAVFAYAMLSSPATIELDIGLNNHAQWNASAGVSIGSVPFPQQDHQIPYIQIVRGGTQVKAGYGSVYVDQTCPYYNFNPYGRDSVTWW